ncbi:hypothetical protein PG985_012944 [Apiospora marii]|uniref:uncharacterized protein n=1 Tax=Apiospora marii TaxID=335849 RepID=UPI00312EC7C1
MKVTAMSMPQDTKLHCIGAGACGSVWSTNYDDGNHATATAFNREDGAKGRSLLNDYQVHLSILQALQRCPEHISTWFRIPQCHGFVRPEELPPLLLQRFQLEYQQPCNILISQRIPPLSKTIRDILCDKYCPPRFLNQIKADPRSVDCMIRPYLGRRRGPASSGRQSKFQSFSLRNHVVSVDQMDDLEITAEMKEQYAVAMARALAFMHWCARIDADDVEFVLSPPPPDVTHEETQGRNTACFESQSLGRHSLWILDFDRCKPLTLDEEGITLAKKAFYRNDLYFPRPGRAHPEDQRLWSVFKSAFLDASQSIIKSDACGALEIPEDLPIGLMEAIEFGVGCSSTTT